METATKTQQITCSGDVAYVTPTSLPTRSGTLVTVSWTGPMGPPDCYGWLHDDGSLFLPLDGQRLSNDDLDYDDEMVVAHADAGWYEAVSGLRAVVVDGAPRRLI